MNSYLLYGTFFFLGLVLICWIVSLIQVGRKGTASAWVNRGLYLAGIAAVVLNIARMFLIYEHSRGTMVFANLVVLVCIGIAFVRSESGQKKKEEK